MTFENFYTIISEFSWVSSIIRVVLAAIMGGLIGSERGRHGRAAGLRTHILVCVGAALTSLTGLFITSGQGDVSRISAQVISGIGFLGAGMILVRNKSIVTGLTTAAGMWATASIGIAVGYGFYSGSIIATVICIFSVTFLSRIETKFKQLTYIYAEIENIKATNETVDNIKSLFNGHSTVEIVAARSKIPGNLGLLITAASIVSPENIKSEIVKLDNVVLAIEENN